MPGDFSPGQKILIFKNKKLLCQEGKLPGQKIVIFKN